MNGKLTSTFMRKLVVLAAAALMLTPTVYADQVINDDCIVIGSQCVGIDCVNGENFGFDTLRLKENNLRFHFDDTSTINSFPRNDWRLIANDSANGGNSFLAIEDSTAGRRVFEVRAGAPSNSLFVSSAGRVGIKTNSPVVELHLVDGDTPTLRLQQDGSSGFTPQTWDVAANETNFFIRDVTNGSQLPLRIRPGAPTSSIDVASSGNVGFGTGSPDSSLHVRRTGGQAAIHVQDANDGTGASVIIEDTGSGGTNKPGFELRSPDVAGASNNWRFETSGDGDFQIDLVATAGAELRIQDDTAGQGNVFISHDLNVTGNVSKGGGSFRIDHPLDPEHKYLSHSYVESPDMMNVYNGNTVLDKNGETTIEMPNWFDALNRDFRYQLTAIGSAAPDLHVAEPIADNRFKISGGKPRMQVSWQVTGIRKDAFAERNRIRVEEDKPQHLRGYYLHPEAYGQPTSKAVSQAPEVFAESN